MNPDHSGSLEEQVGELPLAGAPAGRGAAEPRHACATGNGCARSGTRNGGRAGGAETARAGNAGDGAGVCAATNLCGTCGGAAALSFGRRGGEGRSLAGEPDRSQWFNRVGILAVLIGMAWFLKLAIDNHWIGPLGRVLIGLVAGAGLIAWSERFRSRGYAAFSYSLKAVGSGVLYLSLWAAFSLFHLIPAGAAFAAMIVVTAFNGFMAWMQDAELLALYAIAGGLSTPMLLSTGENHEVTLFSYLLLLDVAVLILVALRPWSRLLFAAFAGTVLFIPAGGSRTTPRRSLGGRHSSWRASF